MQSQICIIGNRSNLFNVLHLFTTNDKVNEHNDYYLQNLGTDHCICEVVDYTIGDVTANAIQTVLNIAKDLPPQKTHNLLRVLQIKLSAQYILTLVMGSPMAPQEFYSGLRAPVENLIHCGFVLQTHPLGKIYAFSTSIFIRKILINLGHLYLQLIDSFK